MSNFNSDLAFVTVNHNTLKNPGNQDNEKYLDCESN